MPSPLPPTAERRPHVRDHHGDRVEDPYAWMRDLKDPALLAHLEAENAYAEARTEHLAPLRTALFEEIRSRVKETDLSVPVVSGPWWYYARTVEGKQYASHVRAPLTDPASRPDPEADAVPGEQVVVDGNVEAGDSEFFSLGALTVSADHRLVAFAVDTSGDERFDLTVREVETGEVLDTSITDIGYGVELSRDGRFLFYTRLDDAWRPYQLWRHRVGGDPADDVLVHQEDDERFWMGVSSSRDERWVMLGLGSKTTSEVHLLDSDDPEGPWHVVAPRREGVEYDVEPAGDRLLVVHNTDTPDADLAWAPIDATSHEQWVPWLRSGEGERFVSADAFDHASVLTLRAGGLTALRVLPRDPASDTGHGAAWDVEVEQAVHSIGLGDNPEPGQTAIQVVVESWATPRTVLDVDLATGERTLLKRQPVLGDFDAANYTEQPRVGHDGRRHAHPGLGRAPRRRRAGRHQPRSRHGLRRLRDLLRPVLLRRPAQPARPRRRLRGGPRARRRRDGPALVRRRQAARQAEHVLRHRSPASTTSSTSGWFDPARVGLEGGSAGGLLVGAVLNLGPEPVPRRARGRAVRRRR